MENFIFSLNATVPVFLVILLGFFLQKIHFLNEPFNKTANAYVFRCALPVSLFRSIAEMDFYSDFNLTFCLFCFVSTTVMFFTIWAAAWIFMKDKGQVGAFAQAAARSSAAVLGIAFATNIYGNAGMVPLMIMSAVPFFNIYSVLILSFSPQVDENGHLLPTAHGMDAVKKACVNVAKNPLILGILAGVPFALLQIKIPTMLDSALNSIGGTATPIVKLFLLPAIFLPLAAMFGFRDSQMIAIMIMAGSPTTVSCFIMAKSMKADSVLTSNVVLLSTVLSACSITFWLYLMRAFGWI